MIKRFNILPLLQGAVRLIPFRCIIEYRINVDHVQYLSASPVLTLYGQVKGGNVHIFSKALLSPKNEYGFSSKRFTVEVFNIPDKQVLGIFAVVSNCHLIEIKRIAFHTKDAMIISDQHNSIDPGTSTDPDGVEIVPPIDDGERNISISGDNTYPYKVGSKVALTLIKSGPENFNCKMFRDIDGVGRVYYSPDKIVPLSSQYPSQVGQSLVEVTIENEGINTFGACASSSLYKPDPTISFIGYTGEIVYLNELESGIPVFNADKIIKDGLSNEDIYAGYEIVNEIYYVGQGTSSLLANKKYHADGDIVVNYIVV